MANKSMLVDQQRRKMLLWNSELDRVEGRGRLVIVEEWMMTMTCRDAKCVGSAVKC